MSDKEKVSGEEVEVVAWLSTDCIGERYLCFSKPLDNNPAEELMTVAQHQRITEALRGELVEQARLNGMGAERELALMAERDQLRAELERRPVDGWKLVPVEPTPEMLDAAIQDGICVDGKPVWKKDVVFQAKWKYQQMLAAAPSAQAAAVAPDCLSAGAWRAALEKIAKHAPPVNQAARTEIERVGLIAVHALIAFSAPQFSQPPAHQEANNGAAPSAPVTVQGDGWIPVSERLPDVEQRLDKPCELEGKPLPPLNITSTVQCFDGTRVFADALEWFDGGQPMKGVTHWKPLDAAPAAIAAAQEGGKV